MTDRDERFEGSDGRVRSVVTEFDRSLDADADGGSLCVFYLDDDPFAALGDERGELAAISGAA